MKKRLVAGSLWFVAMLAMYELAWSVLGVPRPVGPVIAFAISALVVVDPGHVFWPAQARAQRRSVAVSFGERVPVAE